MTFFDIIAAMKYRTEITVPLPTGPATVTNPGITGLVAGIRPEDGSGRCWLITIIPAIGQPREVFWREPR